MNDKTISTVKITQISSKFTTIWERSNKLNATELPVTKVYFNWARPNPINNPNNYPAYDPDILNYFIRFNKILMNTPSLHDLTLPML